MSRTRNLENGTVKLEMPLTLKAELAALADHDHVSMNQLCVSMLSRCVGRAPAALLPPSPASTGQRNLIHKLLGDLVESSGTPKEQLKDAALERASEHFGVPLKSTTELNSDQASWVIDHLREVLGV